MSKPILSLLFPSLKLSDLGFMQDIHFHSPERFPLWQPKWQMSYKTCVYLSAAHQHIHPTSKAHHQIRPSMTLMRLRWLICKEASEMGSTNSSSKEWHVIYKIIRIWNVMIIEAGKWATQEVCPSERSVNVKLGGCNPPEVTLSIKQNVRGLAASLGFLPVTRLASMGEQERSNRLASPWQPDKLFASILCHLV